MNHENHDHDHHDHDHSKMDHSMHHHAESKPIEYIKFAGIILGVLASSLLVTYLVGEWFEVKTFMRFFMGIFFLVFGFFKVINLKNFVGAYISYDIVAKRFMTYGYIYPFLELGLAVLFLAGIFPVFANVFTLVLMIISSIGVFSVLFKKQRFMCACLGTVIELPVTHITLVEDLGMGAMALYMLIVLL